MKICTFCGCKTDNDNKVCASCGGNTFRYVCLNCNEEFDGLYCPSCGTRYDAVEKICPNCSNKYFSEACPKCGTVINNNNAYNGPIYSGPTYNVPTYRSRYGRSSGLSMSALILSIFGLIFLSMGAIFSIIALVMASKVDKNNPSEVKTAKAAKIISIIGLLINGLMILIYIIAYIYSIT